MEVLFANFSTPTLGFGGLVRMPPTTIFAEAFPPDDEFVQYEPLQGSTFWYGVLTTVGFLQRWFTFRMPAPIPSSRHQST